MKNKSKLKKIKQKNVKEPAVVKYWFYMAEKKVDVEDVKAALADMPELEVQLWKEAGVLEVEVPEHRSMDIEAIPMDLHDEYSNVFLKENGVESLFQVTIDTENAVFMQQIMHHITDKLGGMFCGDTPDFSPVIR